MDETTALIRSNHAGVPPWSHRVVALDGLDLSVVDIGPVVPPPTSEDPPQTLLLIHGAQGNWSHWRANVEDLSRHHRVVVPDLPGFGKSGALPQPDLEGLAQAVAQLLDALAIERVAVIAYSFGSLVGLTLAMRRPDLVDRLMVINPPGWRERSPEMVDLQIKAAIRSKEAGLRAGIEFTLREIMLQNHALLDEACLDQSEFAVRHLRMISKDISRSVDLIAMLESISAPWHVVFSANDPYHRYKLEERRGKLAAVCGHECTTVIRDARHWVQQDQADVFNALVAAFVVGTTPATSLPSEV